MKSKKSIDSRLNFRSVKTERLRPNEPFPDVNSLQVGIQGKTIP